jgi:hypothetical protein
MLVDLGLAGASLGILWLFGLPVVRLLLRPERADDEMRCWHVAPFVGTAAIILPAQTLFYLGVPVGRCAVFLWAGAALAWIALALARRMPKWRGVEWALLVTMIGVYAAQGLGFFMLGSDVYVGSAWHDQFNYVSMAELITHYPYTTHFSDIATQPYLIEGVGHKGERLGQTILHAFFALSFDISTKRAFELVALLGPALTTVAISWLCLELGLQRRIALLTAAVAGLMPALTSIHLECFLSQSLGTPFLFAWLALLAVAAHPPRIVWLALGGFVLAAGWSIYTEYLPLYLGATLVFLVTETVRRALWPSPNSTLSYGWIVAAPLIMSLLAIAFNPLYGPNMITYLRGQAGIGDVLNGVYPWAGKFEGIARLWLGWFAGFSKSARAIALTETVTLLLTGLGLAGLLALSVITRKGLPTAASALLVAPWAMIAIFGKNSYQHYKALSSVAPLLPVGIACLGYVARLAASATWVAYGAAIARLTLGVALGLTLVSTLNLTFRAGGGLGLTQEAMGRGGQFNLVDPAMRQTQRDLEGRVGQTIYIAWFDDFFGGAVVNAWLAYFARGNKVFLVNPMVSGANIANTSGFDPVIRDPIAAFVVVTSSRYAELDSYLRLDNSRFRIYDLPLAAWPVARRELMAQTKEPNRWTQARPP